MGRAKGRQNFVSGKAEQYKVVAKARLYYIILYILFRFTAEEMLSSFCSNRFYVSLFYYYNIYFSFALSASFEILLLNFTMNI